MKYRHQRQVARDFITRFNQLNTSLDYVSLLLQGTEPPPPIPLTLAARKTTVKNALDAIASASPKLSAFIDEYTDAGYMENLGRDATTLKSHLSAIKYDADSVRTTVLGVNTLKQLKDLAASLTSDVPPLVEFDYLDTPLRKANIINDLLDATYYTLIGINENTGQPHGLSAEQVKAKCMGYLNQIPNFETAWPDYLQDDVANMKLVSNYVLGNLDTVEFTELADYIGANIEKLPLFRRMWANV